MNKLLKNRIVIAFFSLLLAFVIGFIFYTGTMSSAQKTTVIKITTSVNKGSKITKEMVSTAQVGGYGLESDVATKMDDVVGKYATADFSPGDLILKTKLSDKQLVGDNSLNAMDGSRAAISITVKNLADGMSNKLMAGDIVSCYIIKNDKATLPPELTYVEVLDVGQSTTGDKNETATVTLLAAPKQALLLAEASDTATVHLAFVYRGDSNTTQQFLDKQSEVL